MSTHREEAMSAAGGFAGSMPSSELQESRPRPPLLWLGIGTISAAGFLGLYPAFSALWMVWTSDPLRSLGMFLLPVSVVLILLAWRELDWELQGTWWGMAPVIVSLLWSLLLTQNVQLKEMSRVNFSLLPLSGSPFLYVAGLVLLFGGVRLLRRAWFPVLLVLLLNPVPTTFVETVDYSLQAIAAHVARSFAMMIGFAPTTPELKLMFSPTFGMFIAPGCDGVRGAATLGYMGLIAGYLKRLSAARWTLFTVCAVLLGYVLNFARLCLLVVYYRLALGHPVWQNRAKDADYVIGGSLCLLATFLFFLVFLQLKSGRSVSLKKTVMEETKGTTAAVALKLGALVALLAFPAALFAKVMTEQAPVDASVGNYSARMPFRVGEYELTRTWAEKIDGTTMMEDGAYSKPGAPGEITLGVWVGYNVHDTMDCFRLRDAKMELVSSPVLATANGRQVGFDSGLFTDGLIDTSLWNARCAPSSCARVEDLGTERLSLRFSQDTGSGVLSGNARSVPILIKIEQAHTAEPPAAVYRTSSQMAQEFVAGLDFEQLSRRFQ